MIDKSMAEKMADEMFDLSFDGYSTKKLAALAGVTEGDAIFLQSGSTKISDSVYSRMHETIEKLLQNESKYLPLDYYLNTLDSNNVQKSELYDGDLIGFYQGAKNKRLANINIWYTLNTLNEETQEIETYKNSIQNSAYIKSMILTEDDNQTFGVELERQYQRGESELFYSANIKENSYVSV